MLAIDHLQLTLGSTPFHFALNIDNDRPHVLLGRSGSGKSTLLNLIAGFLKPSGGDIRWQGESLLGLAPDARPVNTLFQHHNLFDHLSVAKNVGLGLHPGLRLTDEDHEQVRSALDQVGLAAHTHKRPTELSGGERQRVALARCLLRRKPILLMDEPFGALDGATRQEMLILTRSMLEAQTPCSLIVTHDPDDAIALGARVLRLIDGEIRVEDRHR